MDRSVGEIAKLVGGTVIGDAGIRITGVNGIKQASSGDLSFIGSPQYLPFLETTGASALLVTDDVTSVERTLIRVDRPYLSFLQVLQQCATEEGIPHPVGIHATAVIGQNVTLGRDVALDAHVRIADGCTLGDGVVVYANSYVGNSCNIGEETVIYPNVTLREGVSVGARCIIHAGAVLGSDGFGFAPMGGKLFKVPQVGTVVLGDDVEIGTNSAVDRATFGRTVIGNGTKIDNLVQIAHNVEIGEHTVISGMTGIAGSTTIGAGVTIAAQVGVVDHVEIGDGATIAGRSGVATSVKPGQVVSGFPATDHKLDMRILASLRRLPDMAPRVRRLERRIQELEEQLHGKAKNDS
ncbi:MAG: UDP-3-O-(3-hydroxymyristoyl)glucosamine N-acyltransferase [Nitrospiraceae bacterium]|nr:UDP-3-O-(3-hydroxymyristoyl)glucosamine N-acyltransferase [Nitrospiraceae bacterium]